MDKRNYQGVIIIAIIAICLTTLGSVYYLSKTGLYIQNNAATTTMEGRLTNTVSVNGEGKVYATPDMVTISIGSSEIAATTKEAQAKVNDKINQVLAILKQNNIPDKDVQTADLSIFPEYDYYNGGQYLKGQRATQRLNINIKGIDPKAGKVGDIIDAVSKIDKIEVSNISFDIEDKTKLFSQARELAFQKAKQKAVELAKLGEVELLKPVSISDATVDYYPPVYSRNSFAAEAAAPSGGSQIPTGQLEVNVTVDVTFGIR